MSNHVTYETALRLKEAGFPQPEACEFQIWYSSTGNATMPIFDNENEIAMVEPGGWCRYQGEIIDRSKYIFAPTATDILREIYSASLHKTKGGEWAVYYNQPTLHGTATQITAIHESPEEACAAAWLELKR